MSVIGIVFPAIVFVASYAVTYFLYRHFSKGRDR